MPDGVLGHRDLPPATAIETDFPLGRVNRLAALEAYNKHHYRPTNYQHKWWARRLGSVFRTISIAALSDPGCSADDIWDRYAEPVDVGDALVFDPFMGGGTTGQETTRLGARFVGADLNPVAWFVARMALAPQPDDLDAAFERVRSRSRAALDPYYRTRCPDCGGDAGARFYLWVELVDAAAASVADADGPARRYETLVVDHRRDGGATVVCPACGSLSVAEDPETACCSTCDRGFDATREDVHAAVEAPRVVFNGGERPAYEPYAVKYDCDACGTVGFSAFGDLDADRFEAAAERYEQRQTRLPIPEQAIPTGGEKTADLHNRNYTRWTHLFNARQLLALGTLLENVRAVEDDLARQYLTLSLSATLEFNTMFCSYKGSDPRGPGAVRHIFSHHAYVHPQEPLENNPLGTTARQSGTFPYLFEYRLQRALEFQRTPVERVLGADGTVAEKRAVPGERIGGEPAASVAELLEGAGTHYLHCGTSADLPFADDLAGAVDAVITDPPYYDSVQYGELADFFYVWLRQGLRADFPDTFDRASVVSAAEAVGNRTRDKSLADYRRLLEAGFGQSHDLLREDGVLVFTFHHRSPAAWAAVLEAIEGAGFRVVRTYPVRGENRLSVHIKGQRAVLLDSVIVCRKGHDRPDAEWSTVYDAIERSTRERLREFRGADGEDLSRLDASVVARGACLTAYSAFDGVFDGEERVSEREAMERIEGLIEDCNEAAF